MKIYRTDVLSYHCPPRNAVDAQFNLPYMVAVSLLRGAIGLDDFTEPAIADAEVLDLARRIGVTQDPGYTAQYPERYPTELTLRLRSGEEHRLFNDCPSGDPAAARYAADPGLLYRETEVKVPQLLAACGFQDRAGPLKLAAAALSQARDVSALTRLLKSPPSRLNIVHG